MQTKLLSRRRPNERGQTIIFVAISIVSLLAMATLAIDIVTLYVARSEIQRTADAAALAGAKAIADSGYTTLPTTDPHYIDGTALLLAQSMATASINAMVTTPAINLVGGQLPVLVGSPTFNFTTHPGSYQVAISLKSVTLPTFFSKIWSRNAAFVTASATAEAYNPANLSTMTPIALKSVKPWLIANADPYSASLPPTFIDSAGGVEPGVIGEILNLTSDCPIASPNCPLGSLIHNPLKATTAPKQVDYVPALVADNSQNVCPACAGGNDFEQSIACADVNAYAGPACGGSTNVTWDSGVNPGGGSGHSADAAECLIHASTNGPYDGGGNLQDKLDFTPWPGNPMKLTAHSGPQSGNLVTTSSSIVTIPIIDTSVALPASGQSLTVVGYMQAFINGVQPGFLPASVAGDINVTVLNIAGCSLANNGANPVIGGSGTSPIPVRLITSP
jgi:hypothetical protein